MTIRLNGHFLEMYDSIDELPFSRFQEYNRALLIDSGLGSDLASIGRHINQARKYNAAKDQGNTEQALLNMYQAVSFTLDRISPEGRAFVVLIHRLNGNRIEDLSEGNVDNILRELSRRGLTIGKVRGFLDTVKKNWMPSWKRFSRPWRTARKRKNTIPA